MKSARLVPFSVIALAIAAIGVSWWYFAQVPSPEQQATLNWYVRKAQQWELQARILRIGQVGLAATAIIASVLSASQWKPAKLPTGFLAVLAAVSIALLTGLDLTNQANKVRNAERRLTVAILKHRQTKDASLENLLKAYQEAEGMVGDYTPQVSAK